MWSELQHTGYLLIDIKRCKLPENMFLVVCLSGFAFGVYYIISGILMHKEAKRINKLNQTVDNLLNSEYNCDIIDIDGMGFSHPLPPKDRTIHDVSRNRLVWDANTKSWAKIKDRR